MVLNLWRIMRSETKLAIYTMENVVFEVSLPLTANHRSSSEWS